MADLRARADEHSVLDPLSQTPASAGFLRVWRTVMSARVALSIALLALSALVIYNRGGALSAMAVCCAAYALLAAYTRWFTPPLATRRALEAKWPQSIGVDVVVFALLHAANFASLNFAPLFTVPVLTAAILGSGLLSLATAAAVSIFLLVDAWYFASSQGVEITGPVLQAGVSGIGFFGLAMLAHSLAVRLASEEATARLSDSLVRMQIQVNQMVIDALNDGVLMVDANGVVRSLNPAARQMLESPGAEARSAPFVLAGNPAWLGLASLAAQSFVGGEQSATLELQHPRGVVRRVQVKTRIAQASNEHLPSLCVMFVEDLREIEARVRIEKLAAMGRMSAAVAHEIRNPLAAISQANALLAEGLVGHADRRLSTIIHDNGRRLGRIVDEVLSVSRVNRGVSDDAPVWLEVHSALVGICDEWAGQNRVDTRLSVHLGVDARVRFESDHLRQVLVNLLDNAKRFASSRAGAIRVETVHGVSQFCVLVWSDGPPLDPGVQTHLFEPFFSSESRSSGLGLYICRELCERHGASIGYARNERNGVDGNEFAVVLIADGDSLDPGGSASNPSDPDRQTSVFDEDLRVEWAQSRV